jgi:VanZ family protein
MPALAWMAVIFVMSSRSSVPQSPVVPSALFAAVGHLFAYALLAVLLARALEYDIESIVRRYGLAWLLSVAYGASDEFHQSFVPGRQSTVADVAIDAVGAAIGLLLMFAYLRLMLRRKEDART